jgi:hypothetical protein
VVEDLSELVARLEREHAALDAQVLAREQERKNRLAQQRARVERAESRTRAALEALEGSRVTTQALMLRRESAFARAKERSGKLWMNRQTGLVGCFIAIGVASWPLLTLWGARATGFVQLGLFALALLVIPRRK